jgi:O-methyltransferase domain
MRCFGVQMGDEWSVRPWEAFTETVKSGSSGINLVYGKNAFEVLRERPEQAEHFNHSMSSLSAAMQEPILNAYDFSSIQRLADVGGGHGQMLSAVLHRYPQMKGVLYDLPEVIAGAHGQAHVEDCGSRMQLETGSFFDRVPAGCDAYMMKFILHDWSDEHCIRILRCIGEQLSDDGRVIVLEQIVTSGPEMSAAKLLDLEMLALTDGGRERTEEEFARLFESAGLKLARVIPTQSIVCILEARKA